MRFLNAVLDILFPPRERALRARSVSYATLAPLISPVRITAVAPPAIALLPYRHPAVQAVITEAKFNGAKQAQQALGAVLASYLATLETPGILIPVPLSDARWRERGYNQAERICREAVKSMPSFIVGASLLERMRDTVPQTNLDGRARRQNLIGAFGAVRPLEPDTLYIVVDDVITTGSTLAAASTAVQDAGAKRILPLALAHSP